MCPEPHSEDLTCPDPSFPAPPARVILPSAVRMISYIHDSNPASPFQVFQCVPPAVTDRPHPHPGTRPPAHSHPLATCFCHLAPKSLCFLLPQHSRPVLSPQPRMSYTTPFPWKTPSIIPGSAQVSPSQGSLPSTLTFPSSIHTQRMLCTFNIVYHDLRVHLGDY